MQGILFTSHMIKAIIRDVDPKTVTRRLSGLQELNKNPDAWVLGGWDNGYKAFVFYPQRAFDKLIVEKMLVKPRYHPGEIVYSKEAWATDKKYDALPPRDIPKGAPIWFADAYMPTSFAQGRGRWRSSMFLMEWMARYFIKFKSVRAERLQSITPEDCLAEGLVELPDARLDDESRRPWCHVNLPDGHWMESDARHCYQTLWDSINKKHPWASNPWNLRYEFERVNR